MMNDPDKRITELKDELNVMHQEMTKLKALEEDQKRVQDALPTHVEILKTVCAISGCFLRSTVWNEKNILEIINRLGKATKVSRISVFENSIGVDGGPLTSKHYEWFASKSGSGKDGKGLQVFSWKNTGWKHWKRILSKGEIIQGSMKGLSLEKKGVLSSLGIESIVAVPIFLGQKWWGFISFEECTNERKWSSMEIDALKMVGEIFGALIFWEQVRKKRIDSEKKFRNLSEEISDGVAVMIDRKIHWVNKAFSEIFGYEKRELIGKVIDFLIIPEEIPKLTRLAEEGLTGKTMTCQTEFIAEREDGNRILIDCTIKRIIFQNSPGIQLLIRDITEHKKVELALRETEERFRVIVQNAPFPVTIFDSTGVYLYVNRKFTEVFGYTLEDIPTGKRWFDLAFPDPNYRKEVISTWKSDMEKSRKRRFMPRFFSVRCKDGTSRDIIFRPLTMNDDKLFIIYEDITDRKRAEDEIYKAKEYLEKILNSVTDSIIVTDLNTRVVTCNNATEKIFGYRKEELIRRSIRKLCPGKQAFKCLIKNSLKNIREQGFFEGEIDLRKSNGQTFPVSLICSMLVATDGKPIGIVAVGRDITERKQAEEAKEKLEAHLRQSQKLEAIGTLAGGIAHDFNNILSVILGYSELTMDSLPGGIQARSNLEEILKACHRGKDLVKQILTFSRKVEQERKPVEIAPIVHESLSFIRASLPSTIEIRQKIDTKSGVIMANATQIYQIIMNLCSNAYYAMREKGGVLEVSLGEVDVHSDFGEDYQDLKEGTYIKLSVRDSGHGIEKSNLERIFDPFFTTKPIGEGTGMGLSTVHGIVEAHEGLITVDSEPGKGTIFDVYLPLLSRLAAPKELKLEPVAEGKEHVLFVDDEESIAHIGKLALERLGYCVTASTSSTEAKEIFDRNPEDFDIVVTDHTLPNMTGIELAKELRHTKPTIPIILTTGYSDLISKDKASELGICDYITKPFLINDLARAIRKVMDQDDLE
jgi:PAS domain S-box-containing protein